MSVAFRRESDEEHKEPRFELPIPSGPNLVTRRGLAQIDARVTELEAKIADETDDAARDVMKRDLRYWHTRQTTAEIAPPPPADIVGFGSRVGFRLKGARRSIDIVGGDEAEPSTNRIAFSAPLARALMGTGVGDHADFNGEADAIEILEVDRIEPGTSTDG